MNSKRDRYVVGLDIGTTKVTCIVSEATDDGRLDVIGIGSTESKSLRKGMVINLESTVDAIKRVVEEAELMAGVEIEAAYVGLAGTHIKGFNSRGVVAITGKTREITREDIYRAIDAAKGIPLPSDREIVHVLPQEFVVDGQDGIFDPTGMNGSRLDVSVHIVTASITATQNVVTCVNRAGLEVVETVLEQLAAAEAVLTVDEKELGVALVDIGGGTTDLAIFDRGAIWHTAVLPTGGEHFSSDVAIGLRTPTSEAEKIKKKYGCALATMIAEDDTIEVASMGPRKPRILPRHVLSDILQPRAEEICHLVAQEVRRAGYERNLNAGVVLTGGSAALDGLPEVAERIFDMPIRRGLPTGVGGLMDVVASPAYATAVGLVLHGHRSRQQRFPGRERVGLGPNPFGRVAARVREWLHELV